MKLLSRCIPWFLVFLAGCATVQDSSRPRIAPDAPGKGIIYFIHDMPMVGAAAVFADGVRLIQMEGQVYTWYYVEPGVHEYSIVPNDTSWTGPAAASVLKIEAGKRYYVNVSWYPKKVPVMEAVTSVLVEPIVGSKPYKPHGLIKMPESDALKQIEHCRFVDPVP